MNKPLVLVSAFLGSALSVWATSSTVRNDAWFQVDTLPREEAANHLRVIARDPFLDVSMGPSSVVISGDGRQPFLFETGRGTLFCQAQLLLPPFHSKKKQVFFVRMGTAISRDGGQTWKTWTHQEGEDDVNLEGGAVQCADGTIVLLDTYVMAADKPGHGVAEIWKSHDDLRTVEGPIWADVRLPHIAWGGSTDDRGSKESSARVHRSVIAMPNGDLIATMYGKFDGDTAPASYMVTMLKSRVFLIRSRDQGASWAYLSTVAMDSGSGTEGFDEPVLVRISRGAHAGRLLCLMRTGRDLAQAYSDDGGVTWSEAQPMKLPGIDIRAIHKWEGRFGYDPKAPDYVPRDEMIGALVDPDLIQMRDGTLVCSFGFRAPEKRYKENWRAPENGDYLAFSRDGGDTWSEVVQFRSGAPTTQYTGVREVRPGQLYIVYDDCMWKMPGHTQGFVMSVQRRN